MLIRMTNFLSSPALPGRDRLEHFQKDIVMTNNALIILNEYVKKFNMTYMVTSRLNQGVLEHFFGAISSKGGSNDHPSPKESKYRLRKYILARNTEYQSGRGNVDSDNTEWLSSTSTDIPALLQEPESNDKLTELDKMNFDDIGILQEDALE